MIFEISADGECCERQRILGLAGFAVYMERDPEDFKMGGLGAASGTLTSGCSLANVGNSLARSDGRTRVQYFDLPGTAFSGYISSASHTGGAGCGAGDLDHLLPQGDAISAYQ